MLPARRAGIKEMWDALNSSTTAAGKANGKKLNGNGNVPYGGGYMRRHYTH